MTKALTEKNQGDTAPTADISNLTKAFELFSQETARLEKSYNALKKQFKQVNRELEDTNHQLESILGNMTQGLLFVSMDGCLTTCNSASEDILFIAAEEAVGKLFWEIFADDVFGFSLKEALDNEEVPSLTTVQHKGRDLEVDASFVLTGREAHQGMILLVRDITEIRRLQLLTSRNDRMKELGEMAASIAHEIRNPLGGIKGFASLLKRDVSGQPAQEQMADYIVEGAARLDRLVGSVLHYARPLPLEITVTDLRTVIEEACHLVEADEQYSEDLTITCKLPKRKLLVPIDFHSIKAALLNLIVNAAQAMPDGGSVEILAKTEDKKAVIKVSDHGVGIPEENIEKIFSPFFTTKEAGNGFGLSEVHRTIGAHGGNITVNSVVGEGTVFSIELPIRQ